MMSKLAHLFLVLLFTQGLLACSDSRSAEPRLLDSKPDAHLDAEGERLRRMQLVRVVDDKTQEVFEIDLGSIMMDVNDVLCANQECTTSGMSSACAEAACGARFSKCKAEVALNLAKGTGIAITLPSSSLPGGPRDIRLPPQSSAVNAELAGYAVGLFRGILRDVAEAVNGRGDPADSCSLADLGQFIDTNNNGGATEADGDAIAHAFFGSIFVNSFQGGKEAFRVQYENTLAVADAELSSTPSPELARTRAISKKALSRTAAAHLMVGGADGFLGSTSEAFCTSGRLSGPQVKALAILREAALAPADVLNEQIAIETLVDGTGMTGGGGGSQGATQPAHGSVRQRLADAWSTDALPSNRTVFDLYGLDPTDFVAAREALRDELNIFARTQTALLPPRTLENGRVPAFERYAGAAGMPPKRDPAYWAALGAVETTNQRLPLAAFRDPTAIEALHLDPNPFEGAPEWGDNLAEFTDAAFTWAGDILRRNGLAPESASAPAGVKEGLFQPFGLMLASEEYRGRFVQCQTHANWEGSPLPQTLSLMGYTAADNIIMVHGEDLLECATKGTVEGGTCTLPDFNVNFSPNANVSPDGDILRLRTETPNFSFGPFRSQVSVSVADLPVDHDRWYVLAPRLKGQTNPRPGDWKSIVGVRLYELDWAEGDPWCRDVPIVPEAMERASNALEPSREWCGDSQVSCAGSMQMDARLPLEDELTDDQNGVESSWRHYLDLARASANEADAAGQEFIRSALQVDQRTEELELRRIAREEKAAGEMQRLQEICGTSVDPVKVLHALSSGTLADPPSNDLSGIDNGPCTSNTLFCAAGRSVKALFPTLTAAAGQDKQLDELLDCISKFDDTTKIHLGDAALCIGTTNIDMAAAECGGTQACLPGAECLSSSAGLGLFETKSLLPGPAPEAICNDIRALRKKSLPPGKTQKDVLNDIVKSGFLGREMLEALGAGSSMKLDYGGYVSVTLGASHFSSHPGEAIGPEQPARLCQTSRTGSGTDSLFGQTWNCSNVAERADLNRRLYKAAVFALTSLPKANPWVDSLYYLNPFVLPIAGNYFPAQVGRFSIEGGSVGTRENSIWRQFFEGTYGVPALPGSAATGPRLAFALGDARWDIEGPVPLRYSSQQPISAPSNLPTQFAIRRGSINRFSGADLVWGGFDADGSTAPDYLLELLNGGGGKNLAVTIPSPTFSENQNGILTILNCKEGAPPTSGECGTWADRVRVNQLLDEWDLQVMRESDFTPLPLAPGEWLDRSNQTFGTQVFPPPSQIDIRGVGLLTRPNFALDREAALDALELVCEAAVGGIPDDCGEVPEVSTIGSFEGIGRYMECIGNDITKRAATSVYNVPTGAVDHLKNGARQYDARGGELNTAISELRSSLLEVGLSGPIVGGTIARFGQDLRALRAQLAKNHLEGKIDDVRLQAQNAQQIANCMLAAIPHNVSDVGAGASGMVACANAIAQIGFATEINDLTHQLLSEQETAILADFGGRANDYVTTLSTQSIRLSQALEGVQKSLQVIESLKDSAHRSIQTALWHLSNQAGNEGRVTTALQNISEGHRARYQNALQNAKRMSFLAKRAIEQRLGLQLSDMVEDLPLVTAPAGWHSTICTTSGIYYDGLATEGGLQNFADAFIGDYVNKLEQVVESYRLVNNFHEGSDTLVASLRDDIHNTRASCNFESANRLFYASRLVPAAINPVESVVGWAATGCGTEVVDLGSGQVVERPLPDCISVTRRSDVPFFEPVVGQPPTPAYDVTFGKASCQASTCGWRDGTALSQSVALEAGRYRLSWYTTDSAGGAGTLAAHIRRPDGSAIATLGTPAVNVDVGTNGDWNRARLTFEIPSDETVMISFERPSAAAFSVSLSAPMLEKITNAAEPVGLFSPGVFMDTADTRISNMKVCEDTTGEIFRAEKWHRNCVKLCPDGYSSDCTKTARTECYWETSFNLSQRSIEAGHSLKQSGFARGNFNYRIDSLAVNFVGTGLRDCAGSNLPSTCYSGGFIPYSLIHAGPYYVRNHKGQDYLAHLFTGQIEHARGLGIERYITNPLSDTDQKLLEPYTRKELSGRPLDGEFILRVWEEPGVQFHAIEDVQLVLNYRYWTRFD